KHLTERFEIVNSGRVLEIGCGRGDFLLEYSKAGFEAYGIDI
ncbi:unnamed protein product, partial [marine sediment metagenome]